MIRHAWLTMLLAAPLSAAAGGGTDDTLESPEAGGAKDSPKPTVTVGGISSGGSMAHQLHWAYPDLFDGAAIVAGAPYGCAKGDLATALARCTSGAQPVAEPDRTLVEISQMALAQGIDVRFFGAKPTDRVWIFHGALDDVVAQAVTAGVAVLYATISSRPEIRLIEDVPAAHHWPTLATGNPCDVSAPPFLGACDYDAAGESLNFLHGDLEPPSPGVTWAEEVELPGAEAAGLDPRAWVHVPGNCAAEDAACDVHLVLHGCAQSVSQVGMAFIEGSGHIPWAATNDIIVAFPQVVASPANPLACWDWWGYTGQDYLFRDGAQMKVLADWARALAGHGASEALD